LQERRFRGAMDQFVFGQGVLAVESLGTGLALKRGLFVALLMAANMFLSTEALRAKRTLVGCHDLREASSCSWAGERWFELAVS
jgi:hypothetical protein